MGKHHLMRTCVIFFRVLWAARAREDAGTKHRGPCRLLARPSVGGCKLRKEGKRRVKKKKFLWARMQKRGEKKRRKGVRKKERLAVLFWGSKSCGFVKV